MSDINYYRNADMLEITIRDGTYAKIEVHKCQRKDKKRQAALLKMLREKYGFFPTIEADSDEGKGFYDW